MKLFRSPLVLVLLFIASVAGAQDEPLSYANLSSPYFAVKTHLQFLEEDSYKPEQAAKVFRSQGRKESERKQLAIRLQQILNGEGIYIDVEELPRQKNYLDSASGQHKYVLTARHPEIYLVRGTDGRWRYSETTANAIDELYKQVYPFGAHKLLDLLPRLGPKKFFGIHLWQYITILLIVVLGSAFHKLMTFLFRRGISGLLSRMGYAELAKRFVLPVARPASLLFVFMLLGVLVPLVQLPVVLSKWIFLVIRAALPFFATVVFYRLVDLVGIYMERLSDSTENTLDDQLVPLVRKVLRTFVVIVGALFILDNLDFNVTAFLAGLSIGGLAFALAAQDTIKNFFGSLMIFIDKPFQIGDWVTSGEIDGTVEEVGFRSTRIRTFRNSVTYVPNGKLADAVVDNHGLRQYRRFSTKLALTYDTPPQLVELFVEGLRRIVVQHPHTRKDYYEVHLNELGAHSLDVLFYVFFTVPTWSEELKARHEILLQIMKLAETLGIRFAFPTQTLHMETFPGHPSLMPGYNRTTEELRAEMDKLLSVNGGGVAVRV
ncbi:mechanosensitive ion channel family protein [Cesiribacter sp. SM1]|uniref:mechanosensitive ion channel family protein n=1 Tax=Cesiribacter sp. SM1 TaxID=2861196 RepID=UPI001CD50E1D|nr:mechanosensitive ion channel family protein [Cesiribacter sp. SM1]